MAGRISKCLVCLEDKPVHGRGLCAGCHRRQRKKEKGQSTRDYLWTFTINEAQLYWLAGFLEGEGCFRLSKSGSRYYHAQVSTSGADEDTIKRVKTLTQCGGIHKRIFKHKQTIYIWSVSGYKALEVMRKVRPLMSERRGATIDEVIVEHLSWRMALGRYLEARAHENFKWPYENYFSPPS